jgi:hypothetical protein
MITRSSGQTVLDLWSPVWVWGGGAARVGAQQFHLQLRKSRHAIRATASCYRVKLSALIVAAAIEDRAAIWPARKSEPG